MKIDKGILRIIDANYNRAKEGLRVIEDVYRFVRSDNTLRKKIRRLRHDFDDLARTKIIRIAITCRDSRRDPGKRSDKLESKRKTLDDIVFSNLQRTKESLRVLEEFFKLVSPGFTATIKKLRYRIYTLEKEIQKKNLST